MSAYPFTDWLRETLGTGLVSDWLGCWQVCKLPSSDWPTAFTHIARSCGWSLQKKRLFHLCILQYCPNDILCGASCTPDGWRTNRTRHERSAALSTNMLISSAHWFSAITVEYNVWASVLQEVSNNRDEPFVASVTAALAPTEKVVCIKPSVTFLTDQDMANGKTGPDLRTKYKAQLIRFLNRIYCSIVTKQSSRVNQQERRRYNTTSSQYGAGRANEGAARVSRTSGVASATAMPPGGAQANYLSCGDTCLRRSRRAVTAPAHADNVSPEESSVEGAGGGPSRRESGGGNTPAGSKKENVPCTWGPQEVVQRRTLVVGEVWGGDDGGKEGQKAVAVTLMPIYTKVDMWRTVSCQSVSSERGACGTEATMTTAATTTCGDWLERDQRTVTSRRQCECCRRRCCRASSPSPRRLFARAVHSEYTHTPVAAPAPAFCYLLPRAALFQIFVKPCSCSTYTISLRFLRTKLSHMWRQCTAFNFIHFVFLCKSTIGVESSGACPINSDPIAKRLCANKGTLHSCVFQSGVVQSERKCLHVYAAANGETTPALVSVASQLTSRRTQVSRLLPGLLTSPPPFFSPIPLIANTQGPIAAKEHHETLTTAYLTTSLANIYCRVMTRHLSHTIIFLSRALVVVDRKCNRSIAERIRWPTLATDKQSGSERLFRGPVSWAAVIRYWHGIATRSTTLQLFDRGEAPPDILRLQRRGSVAARGLASHQGGPDSIPGFSHVGVVPDDAACWQVFSRFSRIPLFCVSALLDVSHSAPFQLQPCDSRFIGPYGVDTLWRPPGPIVAFHCDSRQPMCICVIKTVESNPQPWDDEVTGPPLHPPRHRATGEAKTSSFSDVAASFNTLSSGECTGAFAVCHSRRGTRNGFPRKSSPVVVAASRRHLYKADNASRIKFAIATKRKALNLHAVFSSQCMYVPMGLSAVILLCYGGKAVGRFNTAPLEKAEETDNQTTVCRKSPENVYKLCTVKSAALYRERRIVPAEGRKGPLCRCGTACGPFAAALHVSVPAALMAANCWLMAPNPSARLLLLLLQLPPLPASQDGILGGVSVSITRSAFPEDRGAIL
ncbi:hypothetical protein PR048_000911 [Dryococelus australis]|uniref:Uncharacterized protein n=1 Tax=Dryococelus australis TaxID=614101 RepID=A0ABQ9IFW5_9NEOP|nr:hypothetical protein PR048_000911 [Dryococelus australis]